MQPPVLLADVLSANSLNTLGEGEILIPEEVLNRLLSSAPLPLPLDTVHVACRSGFFHLSVQLDLRGQGLPLRPRVQQMFELERLRLDTINQFILIRPRGGLQIDEGSVGRRRLSPVARALLTTILHTPTLLKLVRDRFPKNVVYEYGRMHIDLSGVGPIRSVVEKRLPLGHVDLQVVRFLSIHDVDIRKGVLVLRYRFEKERLLDALRESPPPGYYDAPPARAEQRAERLLPPPEERVSASAAERAVNLGRAVGRRGRRLLDAVRRNKR